MAFSLSCILLTDNVWVHFQIYHCEYSYYARHTLISVGWYIWWSTPLRWRKCRLYIMLIPSSTLTVSFVHVAAIDAGFSIGLTCVVPWCIGVNHPLHTKASKDRIVNISRTDVDSSPTSMREFMNWIKKNRGVVAILVVFSYVICFLIHL